MKSSTTKFTVVQRDNDNSIITSDKVKASTPTEAGNMVGMKGFDPSTVKVHIISSKKGELDTVVADITEDGRVIISE